MSNATNATDGGYNRETLEIRYKGKSISDVLDMTIQQGVAFFENIPSISHKLRTIEEVGLGLHHPWAGIHHTIRR